MYYGVFLAMMGTALAVLLAAGDWRRARAAAPGLLVGAVVAAPLLWAHAPIVLVYNLLLLGGIAASGIAMFALARRLTGHAGAALVSAAVFTMAPYRLEHFMHLELQWTMWMPLAFWAVHRAFDERPLKWGILAGLFVWLQVISCVYYGCLLYTSPSPRD